MLLWRLVPAARAVTAFDGEGARLFGGRWNSQGTAAVYLSEHISLSALENLVHADPSVLQGPYRAFSLAVPEAGVPIEDVDPASLAPDWRATVPPGAITAFGDKWVAEARTALLRVPSVIIPSEFNFLANPAHPDFAKLTRGTPVEFLFDPRLYQQL